MKSQIDDMFRTRTMGELVVNVADGVKWARSCTGPSVNKDAPDLTCYGCNGKLSFVKSHTSKRNGIEHSVVSFYRHQSKDNCSSETIMHKAAKHALCVHGNKWRFFCKCGMCSGRIPIEVCDNENNVFKEEVTWKNYKLDVGIMRGESVFGAIEVKWTHASTDDKIDDLTQDNIAWCEVYANRVLDALENNTFEVEVAKCATQICDHCIEQEKNRVVRELDVQLMRSIRCGDELQRKRQCIIRNATDRWYQMKPTDSHNEEQKKWILLTQCVQQNVMAKADELGLKGYEASAHAMEMLDGALILEFGKHKGRTLSHIEDNDWPYLLWLAGYTGHMDDRGRAAQRVAGIGTNYITHELESEAKKMVKGSCFKCQGEIFEYTKQPWKTWCKRCYVQLKNDL